MTESEFKQWFAGFTEGIDGKTPTAKQWAKIKERVDQITGTPVVERHFYDRYWQPYYLGPYWQHLPQTMLLGHSTCEAGDNNLAYSSTAMAGYIAEATANVVDTPDAVSYQPAFNSAEAMLALGRADAKSLS